MLQSYIYALGARQNTCLGGLLHALPYGRRVLRALLPDSSLSLSLPYGRHLPRPCPAHAHCIADQPRGHGPFLGGRRRPALPHLCRGVRRR